MGWEREINHSLKLALSIEIHERANFVADENGVTAALGTLSMLLTFASMVLLMVSICRSFDPDTEEKVIKIGAAFFGLASK